MADDQDLDVSGQLLAERRAKEPALTAKPWYVNLANNVAEEFVPGLIQFGKTLVDGGKMWLTDSDHAANLLWSKEAGGVAKTAAGVQLGIWSEAIADPLSYFHNHPFDAFLDTTAVLPVVGGGIKAFAKAGATERVLDAAADLSKARYAKDTEAIMARTALFDPSEKTTLNLIRMGETIGSAPDRLAALVFKKAPAAALMAIPWERQIVTRTGEVLKINRFEEWLTKWRMNPFDESRRVATDLLNDVSQKLSLMEGEDLAKSTGIATVKLERRQMIDAAVRGAMTRTELADAKFSKKETALIQAGRDLLNSREATLLQTGKLDPELAPVTRYGESIRRNGEVQDFINAKRLERAVGEQQAKILAAAPELEPQQARFLGKAQAEASFKPYGDADFKRYYTWPKGEAVEAAAWAKQSGVIANYLPLYHDTPVGFWSSAARTLGLKLNTDEFRRRFGAAAYNTDYGTTISKAVHNMRRLEVMEQYFPTILKRLEPYGARRWEPGRGVGPAEMLLPVGPMMQLEKLNANFLERTVRQAAKVGEDIDMGRFTESVLEQVRQFAKDSKVIQRWEDVDVSFRGGLYVVPRGAGIAILDAFAPTSPAFLRVARGVTDFMKGGILFLSIPWYVGNMIGNSFLYWLGGGSVLGVRRALMPKFMEYAPDFIRQTAMGSADLMGRLSGIGPLARVRQVMQRWIDLGQAWDGFFRKAAFLSHEGRSVVERFQRTHGAMRTAMLGVEEVDNLILASMREAGLARKAELKMNSARFGIEQNTREARLLVDDLAKLDETLASKRTRIEAYREHVMTLRQHTAALQAQLAEFEAGYRAVRSVNREAGKVAGATAITEAAFDKKMDDLLAIHTELQDLGQWKLSVEAQIADLKAMQDKPLAYKFWQDAFENNLARRVVQRGKIKPSVDVPEDLPAWLKSEKGMMSDQLASEFGFPDSESFLRALEGDVARFYQGPKPEKGKVPKDLIAQAQAELNLTAERIRGREEMLDALQADIDPALRYALKVKAMELQNGKRVLGEAESRLADSQKQLDYLLSDAMPKAKDAAELKAGIERLNLQGAAYARSADAAERQAAAGLGARRIAEKALDDTENFFWNYNSLSYFEKQAMRLAFPFWTWYRNISMLIWRLPYLAPGRTFLYHKWAQASLDMWDDANKPDFLRNYIPIGVGPTGALLWLSAGALSPFNNAVVTSEANVLSRLHPLILAAIETIDGRLVFNQKPIGNDVIRTWNGSELELDPLSGTLRPRPSISAFQLPSALWRLFMTFRPFRMVNELVRVHTRDEQGELPPNPILGYEQGKVIFGADLLTVMRGLGVSTMGEDTAKKIAGMEDSIRRGAIYDIRKELRSLVKRTRADDIDGQQRIRFLQKMLNDLLNGNTTVVVPK